MGTLFEQIPRYEWTSETMPTEIIKAAQALEKQHDITFDQAMDAIREARSATDSDYYRHDLDVQDERAAGFGEILKRIAVALEELGINVQ